MAGFPISVVAQRTGLSTHVIRAWERRYGIIEPMRSPGKHRLYSEADIRKLLLIKEAVAAGYSIGSLATMGAGEIEHIVAGEAPSASPVREGPSPFVASALEAVERLDTRELEASLTRATIALGQTAAIDRVIVPLMERLGAEWQEGRMRIIHEHMASAVVRTLLGSALRSYEVPPSAPSVVVTTLSGQRHELGALTCAVAAASEGWKVTYLGPSVPAEEVVRAAELSGARAVVVSVVFPSNQTHVWGELETIRRYLSQSIEILVGGPSAAVDGRGSAEERAITYLESQAELREKLRLLRDGSPEANL